MVFMWYFMIDFHVCYFCMFGYEEKELHSCLKKKIIVQTENCGRKIDEVT